jgi:hypothetical protein
VAATLLESVGEDGLSDPYRVRNEGGSDSRGRRCFVTNFIKTNYVTKSFPRQPLDLCGDACVIGDGLSEMGLRSALEMTSVIGRSAVALIVTSVRDRAAARLIYRACKLLGEHAGAIASERASARPVAPAQA